MSEIAPALDFVAITDPGTALADLARAQEFRAIVEAPPDVGGRYSALTVFGLVPAALGGVDVAGLLERARRMADACRTADAADQPGAARSAQPSARPRSPGATSSPSSPRLAWRPSATGPSSSSPRAPARPGTGIVPVVGEPPREPAHTRDDRSFVFADARPTTRTTSWQRAGRRSDGALGTRSSGSGSATRSRSAPSSCAGRWRPRPPESSSGSTRSTSPTSRRARTPPRRCSRRTPHGARCPQPVPLVSEPGIAASADAAVLGDTPVSVDGAVRAAARPRARRARLRRHPRLPAAGPGRRGAARSAIRAAHRRRDRAWPPRSGSGRASCTPPGSCTRADRTRGVFLQLTADPSKDLPIPGWDESFGTLIAAQALGDLASLQQRGRRALRLHFGDDATRAWTGSRPMVGAALSV